MQVRVKCPDDACARWNLLARDVPRGEHVVIRCTGCESVLEIDDKSWAGAVIRPTLPRDPVPMVWGMFV